MKIPNQYQNIEIKNVFRNDGKFTVEFSNSEKFDLEYHLSPVPAFSGPHEFWVLINGYDINETKRIGNEIHNRIREIFTKEAAALKAKCRSCGQIVHVEDFDCGNLGVELIYSDHIDEDGETCKSSGKLFNYNLIVK